MTYVMTHSEVSTSLQLTVAREFKKNYRLFHRERQAGKKDMLPEEIAGNRDERRADYAGFS